MQYQDHDAIMPRQDHDAICGIEDSNLSACRDVSSWETLLDAARIRGHKTLLDITVAENGLPEFPVRYHRSCRATFTYKKNC